MPEQHRSRSRGCLLLLVVATLVLIAVLHRFQWRDSLEIPWPSLGHSPGDILIREYAHASVSSTSNELIDLQTRFAERGQSQARPIVVLDWTGFFGGSVYKPWGYADCPELLERHCQPTNNRSLLSAADAVIFHARDINWNDVPKIRNAEQRYIFFCMESRQNQPLNVANSKRFFNWTATFRRDSDIWLPYVLTPASAAIVIPKYNESHVTRLYREFTENEFRNKSKTVAWFASNCATASGREQYVADLKRFVDVDIFGACGVHRCPKSQGEDCLRALAREYHFYLAFENSVCEDYVTEKLGNILNSQINLVPIVLKRSHVEAIGVPSDAFIAVDDFRSTRDLAQRLKNLTQDFASYKNYFDWRRNSAARTGPPTVPICQVCTRLLESTRKRPISAKHYEDLSRWWSNASVCDIDFVKRMLTYNNSDIRSSASAQPY